jgi:hypothetical protein
MRNSIKGSIYAIVLLLTVGSLWTFAASRPVARCSMIKNAGMGQDPIEISLELRSDGFHPQERNTQARRFLLSVDNRSGVSDLILRLSKADGTQIREMRVSGTGGDWTERFDLPSGRYSLTEVNHSSWVCLLIVD